MTKIYDKKKVVDDVSFSLKNQEILCILGPNGAGKTTTINMITGILKKDSGSILFKGKDITKVLKEYKSNLGIVPQDIALYGELTALENIKFFASLYGLKGNTLKNSCLKALEYVQLDTRMNDKVSTFSGGMKRRLNIACAIVHKPEIVIMDEPTVGIDPQSRNNILQLIKKLRSEGMSIIYTTHYMEEVEFISTRIIIMDHGEIIAEGTRESLKEDLKKQHEYYIKIRNIESLDLTSLYSIEGVLKIEVDEDVLRIKSLESVENLDLIISQLIKLNGKIINLESKQVNLEAVFLDLTGKSLRD